MLAGGMKVKFHDNRKERKEDTSQPRHSCNRTQIPKVHPQRFKCGIYLCFGTLFPGDKDPDLGRALSVSDTVDAGLSRQADMGKKELSLSTTCRNKLEVGILNVANISLSGE